MSNRKASAANPAAPAGASSSSASSRSVAASGSGTVARCFVKVAAFPHFVALVALCRADPACRAAALEVVCAKWDTEGQPTVAPCHPSDSSMTPLSNLARDAMMAAFREVGIAPANAPQLVRWLLEWYLTPSAPSTERRKSSRKRTGPGVSIFPAAAESSAGASSAVAGA